MFEKIISEVLHNHYKKQFKEIDLEAVAGGKVTMDLPQLKIWFINGKQINSYFQKYRGKEIEILIKVKE